MNAVMKTILNNYPDNYPESLSWNYPEHYNGKTVLTTILSNYPENYTE
jgi:hypothetical protein